MRALISVLLLHLHLFGYSGTALGAEQSCALPTLDESEFETVELIFENEKDLKEKLNDPKMQEYFRKHLSNNGGSCEEEETTTTITTTVATGSVQPPTITTDKGEKGASTPVETTTTATPPRRDTTTKTVSATSQSTPTSPEITEKTQSTSTQPATTTSYLEETTTVPETSQPTTTMPKTTTDSHVSTTELRVETSKETTTEEGTTVTPTCAPLNKTSGCPIVYEGKCFFFHEGASDNSVTLQQAKQYCEDQGSQLGNIYDDCHYQYIKDTIEIDKLKKFSHWTGMNISFPTATTFYVILGSGKQSKEDWWSDVKLTNQNGHNLYIFSPILNPTVTIKNSDGIEPMSGVFCEKNMH